MERLIGVNPGTETDEHRTSPPLQVTSSEKVNAVIHYYRGEMARMTSWRDRIDRTSNWAITVVAALVSISLSTPTSHHGVILFGMLIISLLLLIEAGRYRFFDVYRSRARQLERYYFAQVMSPQAELTSDWASAIAKVLGNRHSSSPIARPSFGASGGITRGCTSFSSWRGGSRSRRRN